MMPNEQNTLENSMPDQSVCVYIYIQGFLLVRITFSLLLSPYYSFSVRSFHYPFVVHVKVALALLKYIGTSRERERTREKERDGLTGCFPFAFSILFFAQRCSRLRILASDQSGG